MKRMQKWIAILLVLVFTVSALASCSADSAPEGKDDMNAAGGDAGNLYPNYGGNNGEEAGNPDSNDPSNNGKPSINTPTLVENPFIATAENNVSTFSADVDTASYSYFRKLVQNGYSLSALISQGAAFRTEEFLNYFKYTATAPAEGELFGVTTQITNSPWSTSTVLLRMTMQAETAVNTEGNNFVFLIDVSGSMSSADKLPLLQSGFSMLTESLGPNDTVSIVTYSGKEEVVLDGCSGSDTQTILNAINSLKAYGSTNGEAGLNQAYSLAEKHMIAGGNNRIIMASDGDLNVGISSAEQLTAYVEEKRAAGVYLSVLGFGTGNYRDANMEALADHGNGVYYYIDGTSELEKVFGSDLMSTLYTVAEDVKLQLTFDPAYVASYRLIGYENRILNQEDFEDDTKDAGEVGAGHQVTVFYELTLAEGARQATKPWMQLAVRYKNPGEEISNLNEYDIGKEHLLAATEDLIFMECVIQTAMILHNSRYTNGATLAGIVETLEALDLSQYPDRAEFLTLLKKLL